MLEMFLDTGSGYLQEITCRILVLFQEPYIFLPCVSECYSRDGIVQLYTL
jgi:hypothetical protein